MALKKAMEQMKGRIRLGVQAYADGMLIIPKVLAQNAGHDPQDVMVTLVAESTDLGQAVGVDCASGECCIKAYNVPYVRYYNPLLNINRTGFKIDKLRVMMTRIR